MSEETHISEQPWAKALVDIVKDYVQDEAAVRDRQVRQWRKMMRYWDGYQFLWWSEIAHDWRTPTDVPDSYTAENDIDPALYAKVINIYRANGEIIIAAMSAQTPGTIFPPDDADNPDDILASKSKTKLAKLIADHNSGELLLTKALFLLYNQGMVAMYNENIQDEEFGIATRKSEVVVPIEVTDQYCPSCGFLLGSTETEAVGEDTDEVIGQELEEGAEDEVDGPVEEEEAEAETVRPTNDCPNCGQTVEPEESSYPDEGIRVEEEKVPKCREIITAWGPLNVQIPAWVSDLRSTPYLILETEEHLAYLQELYPESVELLTPEAEYDDQNRTARYPNTYFGETPRDLVSVRRVWMRKWAFNKFGLKTEGDIDQVKELKKMFPEGCYCVISGEDLLLEAVPDKLEDHWTVTQNPLSESVHAEPLGKPIMPIQEMLNEVYNLTLESVEHQLPETFVDSEVLDFKQYAKSEARPGQVYPVQRRMGDTLGNAFHEIKGGTLSKEVNIFSAELKDMGQYVVGALPSVFGGSLGETAREYELSRTQALQRLTLTWRMINNLWIRCMDKAVTSYAKHMVEDERYVQQVGGSYVNVWIRKSELEGKTGQAFPESSDVIPVNWNQKRDILLQMMQLKDPRVGDILAHPQNASLVARLIGLSELYIPGDQDRTKQMLEITELIMGQPIEMPPAPMVGADGQPMVAPDGIPMIDPMAPPQMQSSVAIDPELDDNTVEAEICSYWLKSDVGQDMKRTNPGAYLNVLLHFKEHKAAEQQQMMQEAMMMAGPPQKGEVPSEKLEEPMGVGA